MCSTASNVYKSIHIFLQSYSVLAIFSDPIRVLSIVYTQETYNTDVNVGQGAGTFHSHYHFKDGVGFLGGSK